MASNGEYLASNLVKVTRSCEVNARWKMSEEKLRNCPFCGGEAYANETDWKGWWHGWVICEKCGVKIDKQTKDEAIEAWNRRYKERNDD